MEKPEIGQTVYSLNVGNAARRREQVLTEYIVVKVGRKYFTIQRSDSDGKGLCIQFAIDDWRQKTNYCADHRLYTSPQVYEEEKESKYICHKIYRCFEYGHNKAELSLEDLRKIKYILDTGGEKCDQQ